MDSTSNIDWYNDRWEMDCEDYDYHIHNKGRKNYIERSCECGWWGYLHLKKQTCPNHDCGFRFDKIYKKIGDYKDGLDS